MYQTIQVSSRVSVQGDFVEWLPNGHAVVRDGLNVYRGRPIAPKLVTRKPLRDLRLIEGVEEA